MTFWGLNDPTFGCATVSAVVTIKDIGKSSGSLVDVFPPWWFGDLILNIYNPFNIWVVMKMIKWSFCCCNSGPMPAVTFGGSTTMIRTLLHSQPCHAMGWWVHLFVAYVTFFGWTWKCGTSPFWWDLGVSYVLTNPAIPAAQAVL